MSEPNVEIIDFLRPDRSECNIYITNIPADFEELQLQEWLHNKFSEFGLLYEVQIKKQASKYGAQEEFCFAFVKFFSTLAAARAKQELTGRLMLKGSHLKMQFSKRAKIESPQPLYMTRCYELATHYLSFNGWSVSLKKLQPDPSFVKESESQVCYVASVRLHLVSSGLHADGRGRSIMSWSTEDPCSHSVAVCRCKKQAYRHAVEAAFGKVLLVITGSGRVHVEVNTTLEEELREHMDMDPVVQINELEDSPEESSDDDFDLDLLNAQVMADLAANQENGKSDSSNTDVVIHQENNPSTME